MSAYLDINRSILAYCNGVITRHGLEGFQTFDFDAHAVEQELPKEDLIGISEYTIKNLTDHYLVTCMILICTRSDDSNLHRLRPAVDALFQELKPGASGELFSILDENGLRRGYLTVMDDVEATAPGSTKTRPVSGIMLQFAAGYRDLP